ncbi:MAG: hypothetical protein HY301_09255 [Verrucomicrobia bacterium]|nr:hypothetical protein [Verrucomicrobiota bacterium]
MNRTRRAVVLIVLLALSLRAAAQPYVPGVTYFGRSNYIEYIAGNMPLIVSAPHGGALVPAELPDRTTNAPWTNSVLGTDTATETLARDVRQVFSNRYGLWPHVIICRLDRQKIDCNRDVGEGAQSNVLTGVSWTNFQEFIAAAKQAVSNQFGRGFYIDLHGHGHAIQRLELGYLLSASQLGLSDATLNGSSTYANQSSVRELNQRSPFNFATLLRGSNGLGTLLASNGFPSVPSASDPDPGANSYFNGGYNTDAHSSVNGGTISGVQIECNYTNVRDSSVHRLTFATNLAASLEVYFSNHFAMNLRDGAPNISTVTNLVINEDTSTSALPFTIADDLTPLANLVLGKSSSDTNLVPTNNIVLGGSGSNRTVTITPATNASGGALITLTLTDTNGGMDTTAFTLTVNPVNDPPALTAVASRTNNPGVTLLITNVATDPEAPPQLLTFALLAFPTGATLNATSGVFSWRPAVAQADSTNVIQLKVTDDGTNLLSATQQFTVTVRALTNLPATTALQLSNGQWRFTVNGQAGPDYTVMATTNFSSWSNLLVTNSPALPFNFTDTNAGSFLKRFYRVLLGP